MAGFGWLCGEAPPSAIDKTPGHVALAPSGAGSTGPGLVQQVATPAHPRPRLSRRGNTAQSHHPLLNHSDRGLTQVLGDQPDDDDDGGATTVEVDCAASTGA
jgi:hypothetical protein